VLAINDNEFESNLSFVNPVTTNWELKSNTKMTSIKIYNVLGQTVLNINDLSSEIISINTQSWKSGIYILNVESGNGALYKRIIKN